MADMADTCAQGAVYHMCAMGEDCGDCGPRTVWAAPPPPPGPPAPLLSHVPLSALLLLAWCFASLCARGLRAQQLRRYREALAEEEANRPPVAVAVPVFTGVATEAHSGAGGAPSAGSNGGSTTEGGGAGSVLAVRSPATADGIVEAGGGEAAAGGGEAAAGGSSASSSQLAGAESPVIIVQGRRIDREML